MEYSYLYSAMLFIAAGVMAGAFVTHYFEGRRHHALQRQVNQLMAVLYIATGEKPEWSMEIRSRKLIRIMELGDYGVKFSTPDGSSTTTVTLTYQDAE